MPLDTNDLIIENQYLALFVVDEVLSRFRPDKRDMYYDDCVGVAMESLCIAAKTYDPQKSEFSHWAFFCIKRALWRFILKEQLHGVTGVSNVCKMDATITGATQMCEIATTNRTFRTSPDDPLDTIIKKELCEQIKEVASETELQIAELLADGYDYNAIGKMLYRDPVAVRRRIGYLRKKAANIA